jgi:AraC-like DNA-binding protein
MLQTAHLQSPARAYRASTLTSYSQTVERVIAEMHAHISDPLSLEAMAEIACLSPFHFNRIFRSITGTPPGEFLAALRLDAAKRRLLTTSLSVTDVCFDLGYASFGTFTTRFKQLIGLSPIQLRQLADDLAQTSLGPLDTASRKARSLAAVHTDGVTGSITTPGPFSGLIFIGLFPRPIPQGRPVACVTIAAPSHFQIAPVPDGRYFLFAAAVPHSSAALTYLLPRAELLVGAGGQPVLVRDGQAIAPVELVLRPRHVADPPILGVFPPLLTTPAAARARIAF